MCRGMTLARSQGHFVAQSCIHKSAPTMYSCQRLRPKNAQFYLKYEEACLLINHVYMLGGG